MITKFKISEKPVQEAVSFKAGDFVYADTSWPSFKIGRVLCFAENNRDSVVLHNGINHDDAWILLHGPSKAWFITVDDLIPLLDLEKSIVLVI